MVPGIPVIGNLLQLKEKKPHKTFTRWSEVYGPIYSIKMGSSSLIVLNSTETAKEVSFIGLEPDRSNKIIPFSILNCRLQSRTYVQSLTLVNDQEVP